MKFFKDSSFLVSGSADHTARMWRANEDGSYSAAHVLTVRLLHLLMSVVCLSTLGFTIAVMASRASNSPHISIDTTFRLSSCPSLCKQEAGSMIHQGVATYQASLCCHFAGPLRRGHCGDSACHRCLLCHGLSGRNLGLLRCRNRHMLHTGASSIRGYHSTSPSVHFVTGICGEGL